jgi:DNA-binding beta-propeller fold protein YncE
VLFDVAVGAYPSAVAVDDQTGHLFVGDALNSLVLMLSARTGALLGKTYLGSKPQAMVVMSQMSMVFVAGIPAIPGISGSSSLAALDARTGQLLQEVPLNHFPVAMIGDDVDRMLMLDMGSAVLAMSATGSGTPRTYPVLGARFTTQGMAIDQRTGHLFVVNTDNSNSIETSSGLDVLTQWIPWLGAKSRAPYGSLNEIATAG